MKRWIAAAAGAIAGTAIALVVLTQFGGTSYEFVGTVLSNPEPAPEFSLVADTGERTALADFEDQVVLLYFGYTFCPDICPASLAELADAVRLLGEDGDHVQVAMISVDPVRDTPELLGEYVDHFDESFIGLTGTEAEIAAVAESYNVFYEAAEGTAATGYLVDHWAGVVLIDRDGRLVELLSYDTSSEDIAADIAGVVMKKPIIIDTDPGHDDVFAILAAIASPEELDLLAITTVAGNVPLDKTTYNALRLRELVAAHHVPVYQGCVRPMVNELVTAEYVHGETGLDGPHLPEPTSGVESVHAVDYLVDMLMAAADRSVTVCLIGPMTNMGMALVKEPAVADKIAEFVIMGGSFHAGGNVTPTAEFNIYVDPHATHVVFTSGVPMTIMPLDVTHQAQATKPRVAAFRSLGDPVGDVVSAMLDFVENFDVSRYGFEGFPLHDPTVIAYLLEPEIFQGRPAHVSVVLEAGAGHGMTVADWWNQGGSGANATVMMSLDADRYYRLLTERLARF